MTTFDPKLLELIKIESRKQAEAVYAERGTQYAVADVPDHNHNGVNSNQIPASSIQEFVPLDSTGLGVNASLSGVLAVAAAEGQFLNDSDGSKARSSGVYLKPVPIIYGHGVGVGSQFDGGIAPDGTMLIFSNPAVAQELWWKVGGQWWGVGATAGYGSFAAALGPN